MAAREQMLPLHFSLSRLSNEMETHEPPADTISNLRRSDMRLTKIIFRVSISLLLLSLTGSSIFAGWSGIQQPGNGIASFRWQGEVDDTSFIRIRGRQVQSQNQSGLPVQNQQFDFTDPLPNAPVQIVLAEVQGRGRVNIIQQPRPENNYTAVVRIDDSKGGRSPYSFVLRWYDVTRRDRAGSSDDRSAEVSWSGRVDSEAIIRFRGDQVRYENVSGQGVSQDRYRFSSPLPPRPVSVSLVGAEGRGEITLVEQPSRGNDHSAAVRIRDDKGGGGSYAFTLIWNEPRNRDFGRDRGQGFNPGFQARGGLRWTARVDGRDILYINGNSLRVEHQAGQPLREENYRFLQSLPSDRRNVVVRKLSGRGNVTVIQQPSRENGYTAAILIDDRDGGSDRYDIEVGW
jgi:hypothetical protein